MTGIILRQTIEFIHQKIVESIEAILIAKNKEANLVEHASYQPVIDCPNENETCTIDRVSLKWDTEHKNCYAVVDYSNTYMNDWQFVKNLPIETALDILDCLESENVWEDNED